jgi:hypothetical protein
MVEYEKWIKHELKIHKVRVHKWGKFNENETYYAYFNSRRVFIPIPECTYSLLIALHEIGHLVKGNHIYGYIAEYKAEMWAMSTALKKFKIKDIKYEISSKKYIYETLLEDIVFRLLPISKIHKSVIKWIGTTPNKIKKDAINLCSELKIEHKIQEKLEAEYIIMKYKPKKKKYEKKVVLF